MDIRIKNIILWPKDESKEKRIIPFELDKVNVITGESHKGKSSLLHIIDYCLGSGKCTIPVGIIRDKTAWFALHVITNGTEMLFARKEPGQQTHNDEMYIEEAVKVDINVAPRTNSNRKHVKNRLNQMAGFSSERFDNENLSNNFKGAASFRDTSSFQFQPQHIVANPFTLFYKADTFEHQQKLRTIFPLVLGIISNKVLSLERELKDLETLLKSKKQVFVTKNQAIASWMNNLATLFNRATALGLVKNAEEPNSKWDSIKYLSYLTKVLEEFKTNPIPSIQEGATEKAVQILNSALKEEQLLSSEIAVNRFKLSKMEKLNYSSQSYQYTLEFQQKRLEPISWFKQKLNKDSCPFCDSKNETARQHVNTLVEEAKRIEEITNAITTNDLNLDKEVAEIRKDVRELESKLTQTRDSIRIIYSESSDNEKQRQSLEAIYKFIGRLEEAIDNVQSTEIDSILDKEIKGIETKIESVKKQLLEKKGKNKVDNVLQTLSTLFSKYVEVLDIDKPKDLVKLDIQNLSLKIVSSDSNRENFLWEVGSGANWMGYHLSTMLGLHEYFITLPTSHIPRFLVIDQPSQVYFPEKFPEATKGVLTFEEYSSKSGGDLVQVRKIFKALSTGLDRMEKKVQFIVVEHAPPLTWEGIENIHLVDEWRGENALIPINW